MGGWAVVGICFAWLIFGFGCAEGTVVFTAVCIILVGALHGAVCGLVRCAGQWCFGLLVL